MGDEDGAGQGSAGEWFPNVRIVDFFHAAEYLRAAGGRRGDDANREAVGGSE